MNPECTNCRRVMRGGFVLYSGLEPFCSALCRDVVHASRSFAQGEPTCGVPNCHVCSGAMRERAGKGDDT